MAAADTVIWVPLIVLGAILFAAGSVYARYARQSWNWSVADAVITKVGKLNLDSRHIAEGSKWDTTINLHVEYAYSVGDEQWKNEHIARWRSTRRRDFREAEEFQVNNPVGKRFQILYNPENHFDSLLNGPRNPAMGTAISVFGLAAIVFGLINWFTDPSLVVQAVIASVGVAISAGAGTQSDYPFERPWWFEKSEGEAAQFMKDADMVQRPDERLQQHRA